MIQQKFLPNHQNIWKMTEPEIKLSETKVKQLKKQVLETQVQAFCEDMGNPERYFPQLRSAGVLDKDDCEVIRHEVTTKRKVEKFVDILCEGRQGRDGTPAFDVLVDVLNREGVHSSVARGMQKSLARAKEEEISMMGECKGRGHVTLILSIGF